MNQDRFIELLNLYLDEEISADDRSDLMLEISVDPERQRIFREYTRIHQACTQLGSNFESRPARRSIRQTIYAIGGIAAAFALLGMAGRNLMPFMGGTQNEVMVVQQAESNTSGLFFPDVASFEVVTPRFVAANGEPRIHYIASTNGGSPIWSNVPTFASVRSSFGGNRNSFSLRDLLGASKLDLKDPFNGFSQFGEAISIELSRASAGDFGSELALESIPDWK
jgi:hypothetical protein